MKIISAFIAILLLVSCTPARKAMYFPDIQQDVVPIDSLAREASKRIYAGDRLTIQIVVQDEVGRAMLNPIQSSQGMSNNAGSSGGGGYLVDPDGLIEIPSLGKISVAGRTPLELREIIRARVAVLYKDPVVYCSLTGRVLFLEKGNDGIGNSGSIPIVNERLTILEAMAGTSPSTMKLDRVWVIREIEGKRQVGLVNLNTTDVFHSPFFYLRNNDLIYIEPNRTSRFLQANSPYLNLLGVVTGLTGLVVGLFALIK